MWNLPSSSLERDYFVVQVWWHGLASHRSAVTGQRYRDQVLETYARLIRGACECDILFSGANTVANKVEYISISSPGRYNHFYFAVSRWMALISVEQMQRTSNAKLLTAENLKTYPVNCKTAFKYLISINRRCWCVWSILIKIIMICFKSY